MSFYQEANVMTKKSISFFISLCWIYNKYCIKFFYSPFGCQENSGKKEIVCVSVFFFFFLIIIKFLDFKELF